MIIDVIPPQTATQTEWIKIITYEPPQGASDPSEHTLVRVHIPGREILAFYVPDQPSQGRP